MNVTSRLIQTLAVSLLLTGTALADKFTDTDRLFKNAGESSGYFHHSYGYAVFPTIGKGGLGIGGAYGKGRVYEGGRYIGRVSMTQLSVGFQAGGEGFSEIIFFENKDALDNFTSGNFEFGGDVAAVAITAGVNAGASTSGGATAGASGDKRDAATAGGYHGGVAVFTIVKGGLMYQAALQGQKFSYSQRHQH